MKRTLLSLSLLALLAGCANDDLLTQSDFVSNITITAEDIRLAESELATRTDLSVTSSGLQFAWAAEDVVGIYPNVGDQVSFPMTKGAGTQSANFDGGGWAVKSGSTYAAYFPYSVDNTTYGRSYTALPLSYTGQRQTANSSTAHLGDYDYMVATASSPSNGTIGFKFTHINSFLYIQLTTPDAATFNKLTLTTETASFVEKATVNIATGVITPTQSSTSLALDLANIAVTAGSTLYAWLAVAPTDLSGKTIKATLATSDDTKYEADIAGKTLATGTAYILKGTVAAEGTGGTGGDIPFGDDPAHAYVDLGLPSGTLWATCNVGAEEPEEIGYRLAWGDTNHDKTSFNWDNYVWKTSTGFSKYYSSSSDECHLQGSDDAARYYWGNEWRTPTPGELDELFTQCSWSEEKRNGVSGYTLTGPNGTTLFLPANGQFDESGLTWKTYVFLWSDECSAQSQYAVAYRSGSKNQNHKHDGLCVRAVRSVSAPSHAYVDLGLPSGTLWATCNVGAENPEDYGDYFAWGETEPKDTYDWSSYKWCNGSYLSLTKYCTDVEYGMVDNKTVLDLADDAARANWGGSWRMPTFDELDELRTECTWTWTQLNGVKGYKVSSNLSGNTNSIFLPAAGYRGGGGMSYPNGNYWSSSLDASYSSDASVVGFAADRIYWGQGCHCDGYSVRPVCAE